MYTQNAKCLLGPCPKPHEPQAELMAKHVCPEKQGSLDEDASAGTIPRFRGSGFSCKDEVQCLERKPIPAMMEFLES